MILKTATFGLDWLRNIEDMVRLFSLVVLVLFNISQISAQSPQTYVLEKPGTLKKMMKGNEGATNISISGIFNENDLKYITSLQNLKVLDLRNANLSPKAQLSKLREDKHSYILILDTLKCPKETEFRSYTAEFSSSDQKFSDGKDCFYSYYRIFYPRYFVIGNNIQVNFYKECLNNDYVGINIFPDVPNTEDKLNLTGTLYLKDAISVDWYFREANVDSINCVVFSNKIKKIKKNAFYYFHRLDEVVFEDGTEVQIDERAFPREGMGINERTRLRRVRVPSGQIQKFVSLGFPEDIIIDKTPDIKLEVEVKTPGALAEQLANVDLRLIQSLRIKGILNSDDFKTINKMLSLERLDIKDAFVFVSIDEKKADAADVAFLLGMANEGQYQKDGNYQNYNLRNKVNERVKDSYDKTITCELPKNAFIGNPLLESLQLPATLTNINRAGIGGSEGYTLAGLARLKEIWISKASADKIPIERIVNPTNKYYSKVPIKYY